MPSYLAGQSGSFQNPTQSQSSSGEYYSPQSQRLFGTLLGQRTAQPAWNAAFAGAGGSVGPYPGITTAPIWGEPQIQGRVNQSNAFTDQSVGGQQRRIADTAAGRGYGSGSPLAQALQSNAQMQGLGQKTANENNLRWQAAQGNAQQVLAEQQADVERSKAMGQEAIGRANVGANVFGSTSAAWAQSQNALLNALSQYGRPLSRSQSTSQGGGGQSYSRQYAQRPSQSPYEDTTNWSDF